MPFLFFILRNNPDDETTPQQMDATVRFEIDIGSAESVGLKINSRLLDLSQSAREERRKRKR
jgi:hypothetical protein